MICLLIKRANNTMRKKSGKKTLIIVKNKKIIAQQFVKSNAYMVITMKCTRHTLHNNRVRFSRVE